MLRSDARSILDNGEVTVRRFHMSKSQASKVGRLPPPLTPVKLYPLPMWKRGSNNNLKLNTVLWLIKNTTQSHAARSPETVQRTQARGYHRRGDGDQVGWRDLRI